MSAPESIVQAQVEALLRRVAREQEMLTRRTRDAAEEQSRGIVERAREEARARTRQASQEARQSVDRALDERRAALETEARHREQSLLRGLIDTAWAALPRALEAAWDDEAARRSWCDAACALAHRTILGQGPFTVEIDASAPDDVEGRACDALQSDGARAAVRRVGSLGAGLRIRRRSACVDATVAGLLASRERVEAELLAEFDRLREQPGSPPT